MVLILALEGDSAVRQWEERFSSEGGETQGERVSFIFLPHSDKEGAG